jgi:hypothetical protein
MRITLSWLIAALSILLLSAIWARADWKNVAQEWAPYRLNESQKQWFKNLHPKRPGPACCDQADGHPTASEHRIDGYYVPDPDRPDGMWLKVPEDAFTQGGTNPVGVATVWFGAVGTDGFRFIRCFVPEAET